MRAHTVILGAGATVAAIPNGDRYGNKSSVMDGLIDKLGLKKILADVNLKTGSNNLEDIYSELYLRHDCKDVLHKLEEVLYSYFDSLELPDFPTVYDFLVLSLTHKDAIATFNWDPLLLQAYERCNEFTDNLPHIFCLHGNTGMGYCSKHNEFGVKNAICPKCKKPLTPIELLYPVKNKDYQSNKYIKGCWEATEWMIENSYMLTIFGYSAPSTDIGAIKLLKKAWGSLDDRQLEEVSVIDVISEDEVCDKWKDFIYTHHYKYTNNYFDSYLGMFPRRSCETIFATYSLNIPPNPDLGFKNGMSWDDVWNKMDWLVEEELSAGNNPLPLSYSQ